MDTSDLSGFQTCAMMLGRGMPLDAVGCGFVVVTPCGPTVRLTVLENGSLAGIYAHGMDWYAICHICHICQCQTHLDSLDTMNEP